MKKINWFSVLVVLTALVIGSLIIIFAHTINGLQYKVSVLETKIEYIEEQQKNERRVTYEELG